VRIADTTTTTVPTVATAAAARRSAVPGKKQSLKNRGDHPGAPLGQPTEPTGDQHRHGDSGHQQRERDREMDDVFYKICRFENAEAG
jgi:hypothetical protein